MGKTSTDINLDPSLKKAAQELFSDLGLDLTTAVTLFLKQALREQGIPFPITRATPNVETRAAFSEYTAMRDHPEQYKRYSTFQEMLNEVLDEA